MGGIMGVLLLGRGTFSRRSRDSVVLAVISSFPMVVFFARNIHTANNTANRELVFHPITVSHVESALFSLSTWLLPTRILYKGESIAWPVAIVGGLILSILAIAKVKSQHRNQYPSILPYLLTIFIFVYIGFLIISISLFDAHTPLDNRILSPIYASGLILVLCLLHDLKYSRIRLIQLPFILLLVGFAASYLARSMVWVIDFNKREDSLGYASRAWKQSEAIEKVRNLPLEILIYTNGTDAIHFLTGRPACTIPTKTNPGTLMVNDDYCAQLSAMGEQLKNQAAVLVYFSTIHHRDYLPSESELRRELPLVLHKRAADGSIYRAEE